MCDANSFLASMKMFFLNFFLFFLGGLRAVYEWVILINVPLSCGPNQDEATGVCGKQRL